MTTKLIRIVLTAVQLINLPYNAESGGGGRQLAPISVTESINHSGRFSELLGGRASAVEQPLNAKRSGGLNQPGGEGGGRLLVDVIQDVFNGEISTEEIKEISKHRVKFHSRLRRLYKQLVENDMFEDPSRYYLAERDKNRWNSVFIKYLESGGRDIFDGLYLGALANYIDNIEADQYIDEGKKTLLVEKVDELFAEEFGGYYRSAETGASSSGLAAEMKARMRSLRLGSEVRLGCINDVKEQEIEPVKSSRAMVRRSFFTGSHCLFFKDNNYAACFDDILSDECAKSGFELVYAPMGPYISREQILGMKRPEKLIGIEEARDVLKNSNEQEIRKAISYLLDLPVEAAGDFHYKEFLELEEANPMTARIIGSYLKTGKKGQGISYAPGFLLKVVEYARDNPGRSIKLLVDNIESSPAKVRNGIFNQLLEKGDLEIPGYGRIILPGNLQFVFTSSKRSKINDEALYNRLEKHAVPGVSQEDELDYIMREYDVPADIIDWMKNAAAEYMKNYIGEETEAEFYVPVLESLFKRVNGIHQDRGLRALNLAIVLREARIMLCGMLDSAEKKAGFAGYLAGSVPKKLKREYEKDKEAAGHDEFKPYYFGSDGELYFEGVGAGLASGIKEKIKKAPDDYEREKVLKNESGIILLSNTVEMYTSLVRNIKYGNRIIRVVGPTGVGKTYNGEMLGRAKAQKTYCEPIHKRIDYERWSGYYGVSEFGEFIFNDQPPFIDIFANGGGIMLSELNVKPDFSKKAYMSWFLNQIAKGYDRLSLPGVPVKSGEMSGGVRRHQDNWIVIDINPEGSYGSRYELNDELRAGTDMIYIDGDYTLEDYKKFIDFNLSRDIDKALRERIIEAVSAAHLALAVHMKQGYFEDTVENVLSLRELERVIKDLAVDIEDENRISEVINDNYLTIWMSRLDYETALNLVNNELKQNGFNSIEAENTSDKEVLLKRLARVTRQRYANKLYKQLPSVLIQCDVESEGGSLAVKLAGELNAAYEQKVITGFTQEYDFKGGFVPVSSKFTKDDAKRVIDEAKKEDPEFVSRIIALMAVEGGYDELEIGRRICSMKRSRYWTAQLKYAGSLLKRKIDEARADPGRMYLLHLSGFHRLDPEVAVMLNSFFQSGELYLANDTEPAAMPRNLIIIEDAAKEIKLPLSAAEQSRHHRMTMFGIDYKQMEAGFISALKRYMDKIYANKKVLNDMLEMFIQRKKEAESYIVESGRQEHSLSYFQWKSYLESAGYFMNKVFGSITEAFKLADRVVLSYQLGADSDEADADIQEDEYLKALRVVEKIKTYLYTIRGDGGDFKNELISDYITGRLSNKEREYASKIFDFETDGCLSLVFDSNTAQTGDYILKNGLVIGIFLGVDQYGTVKMLEKKGSGIILKVVPVQRGLLRLVPRAELNRISTQRWDSYVTKELEQVNSRYLTASGKVRYIHRVLMAGEAGNSARFLGTIFKREDFEILNREYNAESAAIEGAMDEPVVVLGSDYIVLIKDPETALKVTAGEAVIIKNPNPADYGEGALKVKYSAFVKSGMNVKYSDELSREGKARLKEFAQSIYFIGKGYDYSWYVEENAVFVNSVLEKIKVTEPGAKLSAVRLYEILKVRNEDVSSGLVSLIRKLNLNESEVAADEKVIVQEYDAKYLPGVREFGLDKRLMKDKEKLLDIKRYPAQIMRYFIPVSYRIKMLTRGDVLMLDGKLYYLSSKKGLNYELEYLDNGSIKVIKENALTIKAKGYRVYDEELREEHIYYLLHLYYPAREVMEEYRLSEVDNRIINDLTMKLSYREEHSELWEMFYITQKPFWEKFIKYVGALKAMGAKEFELPVVEGEPEGFSAFLNERLLKKYDAGAKIEEMPKAESVKVYGEDQESEFNSHDIVKSGAAMRTWGLKENEIFRKRNVHLITPTFGVHSKVEFIKDDVEMMDEFSMAGYSNPKYLPNRIKEADNFRDLMSGDYLGGKILTQEVTMCSNKEDLDSIMPIDGQHGIYVEQISKEEAGRLEKLISQQEYTINASEPGRLSAVRELSGERVVIKISSGEIQLWDRRKGELITLKGHSHLVNEIVEFEDGSRLASCGNDGTIKIWDVQNKAVTTLRWCNVDANYAFRCLIKMEDGRLASGDQHGFIKIWDLEKNEVVSIKGHTAVNSLVEFEDCELASSDLNGNINLWSVSVNGVEVTQLRVNSDRVRSLVKLKNSRLAICSERGPVNILDVNGMKVTTLKGHTDVVLSAVELEGHKLASCGGDRNIKIWDIDAKKVTSLEYDEGITYLLRLMPDGRLAGSNLSGNLTFWDLDPKKRLDELLRKRADKTENKTAGVVYEPDDMETDIPIERYIHKVEGYVEGYEVPKGNNGAYMGSFGRIRYINKGDGLYLSIDSVEMKVYDEAKVKREGLLVPINKMINLESAHLESFRKGSVALYLGPPGVGKSATPQDVAKRLGLPCALKVMHKQVDEGELLGHYVLTQDGYLLTCERDIDGHLMEEFLRFYEEGGEYIFDEGAVGSRGRKLLALLEPIASGQKKLYLNKHPGRYEVLEKNPYFHISITTNGNAAGREKEDIDLAAKVDRIVLDSEYTDLEIYKLLRPIYENKGLSGYEISDLIKRQINVHRAVEEMRRIGVLSERSMELVGYGLRELSECAGAIVEHYGRHRDTEIAFLTGVLAGYYKMISGRQDRETMEKILAGQFGSNKDAGSEYVYEKINYLITGISDRVIALKSKINVLLLKMIFSAGRAGIAEIVKELASIKSAYERTKVLTGLINDFEMLGMEKDKEVLVDLLNDSVKHLVSAMPEVEYERKIELLEEMSMAGVDIDEDLIKGMMPDEMGRMGIDEIVEFGKNTKEFKDKYSTSKGVKPEKKYPDGWQEEAVEFRAAMESGNRHKAKESLKKLKPILYKIIGEGGVKWDYGQIREEYIFMLCEVMSSAKEKGIDVAEDIGGFIDIRQAFDLSRISDLRSLKDDEACILACVLAVYTELEVKGPAERGGSYKMYGELLRLYNLEKGKPRSLDIYEKTGKVHIGDVVLKAGRHKYGKGKSGYVEDIRSEDAGIRGIAEGFARRSGTLSFVERGARIDMMIDKIARSAGYKVVRLDGTKYKTVESFFGGIKVARKKILGDFSEIRHGKGLISRYMRDPLDPGSGVESVIIDIRNLHAIPAGVRAALFNILQERYYDIEDERGRKRRLTLPDEVKLHFTMPADYDGDFESALYNRVEKVFVGAARFGEGISADIDVETEFERVIRKARGIDAVSARLIRAALVIMRGLDGGDYMDKERVGGYSDTGRKYDITVSDGYEIARWVSVALKNSLVEQSSLDADERRRLTLREVIRFAKSRIRPEDFAIFRGVFDGIFEPGEADDIEGSISNAAVDSNNRLSAVGGVAVMGVEGKARRLDEISGNYRLCLVPNLAARLGAVLKAISPGINAVSGFEEGRPVVLIGSSSMAKTTLAGFTAEALGMDFYCHSIDGRSQESDITYEYESNERQGERFRGDDGAVYVRGRFTRKLSRFLEAFSSDNQVIMIDEISLCPDLFYFFSGISAGARTIYFDVPGEKTRVFERGSNVSVWFSMNEENARRYSARGSLSGDVLDGCVKVYFPDEYEYEEELAIEYNRSGVGEVEAVIIDTRPELKQSYIGYGQDRHVLRKIFDEPYSDRVAKAFEALPFGESLSYMISDEVIGEELTEESIEELIKRVGDHVLPDQIAIVRQALAAKMEAQRARGANIRHKSKIEAVARRISFWSIGSGVKVRSVVVGVLPTSFDESTGELHLNYKHVEELGIRKLSGAALHEIRHQKYTRFGSIERIMSSPGISEEVKYFLGRIGMYAELHEIWNAKEDVWINHLNGEPMNEWELMLKELTDYMYGWKVKRHFGEADAGYEFAEDDNPGYMPAGGAESNKKSYLEGARIMPHRVFTNELFLKSMTGEYSPLYKQLPARLKRMVEDSQPEWDDITKSKEMRPDFSGLSAAVDGEREISVFYEERVNAACAKVLERFVRSERVLPNFMKLLKDSSAYKDIKDRDQMLESFEEHMKVKKMQEELWREEAVKKGEDPYEYVKARYALNREEVKRQEQQAYERAGDIIKDSEVKEKLDELRKRLEADSRKITDAAMDEAQKQRDEVAEKILNEVQDWVDQNTPDTRAGAAESMRLSEEEIRKLALDMLDKAIATKEAEVFGEAGGAKKDGAAKKTAFTAKGGDGTTAKDIVERMLRNIKSGGDEGGVEGRSSQPEAGSIGAEAAAAERICKEVERMLDTFQRESIMGRREAKDPLKFEGVAKEPSTGVEFKRTDGGKFGNTDEGDIKEGDLGRMIAGEIYKGAEELKEEKNYAEETVYADGAGTAGKSDKDGIKKLKEALKSYENKSLERVESNESVRKLVSGISRNARRTAQKMRGVVLANSAKEEDVLSSASGRILINRFIQAKPDFFEKTEVEDEFESIDVEILIDLSGSVNVVKEALSRMGVFLSKEFGDLAPYKFNFQILGFDEKGISEDTVFRKYGRPGEKVSDEQLVGLYNKMKKHIGSHVWEKFTLALEASLENFKLRKESKRKLLILLSDGQDEDCKVNVDRQTGRHKSSNPGFEPALKKLKNAGVAVVGLGIGDISKSKYIDMFPSYYPGITNEEVMGELMLKIIEQMMKEGSIPAGDLRNKFKNPGISSSGSSSYINLTHSDLIEIAQ